jgi:hypothetical protein
MALPDLTDFYDFITARLTTVAPAEQLHTRLDAIRMVVFLSARGSEPFQRLLARTQSNAELLECPADQFVPILRSIIEAL